MEVILLENIKNLGNIGDVVNVKRGHGRNFLIKYGKALKASKENIEFEYQLGNKLNHIKRQLAKSYQNTFYINSGVSFESSGKEL